MASSVHCEVEYGLEYVLVRLTGQLSLPSSPHVRTTLLKCLAEQPDAIVVDIAGLTVREPTALSVFTAVARQAAVWPGTPVLLCAPTPLTARLMTSGAYGQLPVFATARQALANTDGRIRFPTIRDDLLPVSGAARQARNLVTEACARWDLPHVVAPGCTVASELVSNVVNHAHTMMTLRLALRRSQLHISVQDGSAEVPELATASPLSPGTGRGLMIVDAMARRWGSMPCISGKVVWAVLDVGDPGTPA